MTVELSKTNKLRVTSMVLGGFVLIFGSNLSATLAQSPDAPKPADQATTPPSRKGTTKTPFSLRTTHDQIVGVSLKADEASLNDIAAELGRQLKIPVMLSPTMAKQSVTVNFKDLVLESAMQLLAPEVVIDYELNSNPGSMPKPLGIFLRAYNEPPPPANAVVKSKNETIVFSGHTEDDPEALAEPDAALKVSFERGTLSVKAKDQLLLEVLSRIAEELAIPLEVDEATTDLINVDIVKAPVEDAILQLGPNIRLFVRVDLQRADRRPLRIALVPSEKRT